MKSISKMAQEATNSPIRKMFNIASTMSDIVNFTVGEPDFNTPQNIIDSAINSLQKGQTHYTLNAGILPLREAITRSVKKTYQKDVDPKTQVIVTSGGMEALYLCALVLINPGDEIIISDPHWSNYPRMMKMCGGVPRFVKVSEEDGFIFNPDRLRKAINPKTKAILINSPANPTGGVYDKNTLEEIAKIATENDLYVITDDVYKYFIYDGNRFESITSFSGMDERTIIIDSFSKAYAMTGWRVGFAVGPQDIIANMVKLQENVVGCVNNQAQYAAMEALDGDQESLRKMVETYKRRRDLIVDGINSINGLSCKKPKGAFYAFVNIRKTGLKSEEFALKLVNETGVVVVPGSGFGESGEGFIRLSYATSEGNISEGLKRIDKFVKSL